MFCSKCGNKLPEQAVVCPKCGERVDWGFSPSGVGNQTTNSFQGSAENIMKKVVGGVKVEAEQMSGEWLSWWKNNKKSQQEYQESRRIKSSEELFIDPQEKQKAVIGNKFLLFSSENMGLFETGICMAVTDRRVYYVGKSFQRKGLLYMKRDEERVVDIQDVIMSGFNYGRNILLLLLAVCGLIVCGYFSFCAASDPYAARAWALMALIAAAIAVIFFVLYFKYKTVLYEVTYAGGNFLVNATAYKIKDIKSFDRALRMSRDEYFTKYSALFKGSEGK